MVFLVGALVMGLGYGPSGTFQGIEYHSSVCVYKNNELIQCSPNTLTDEGTEFIETELGTTPSTNSIDNMQLGNGSASTSSSTALDGLITTCGLGPAAITWSSVGTGNISASYEWTSTCDNIVVNTTGLNCTACSSSIDFFAGNSFTDVTLQTNDKINVTWYIWVT
jgi:hypothetical protein